MYQSCMTMRDLQLVKEPDLLIDVDVASLDCARSALFRMFERSLVKRKDKKWAELLNIAAAQFSRIRTGDAHFPTEKIIQAISLANNHGYMQYLFVAIGSPRNFVEWCAGRIGYKLVPKDQKTASEILEQLARESA